MPTPPEPMPHRSLVDPAFDGHLGRMEPERQAAEGENSGPQ